MASAFFFFFPKRVICNSGQRLCAPVPLPGALERSPCSSMPMVPGTRDPAGDRKGQLMPVANSVNIQRAEVDFLASASRRFLQVETGPHFLDVS